MQLATVLTVANHYTLLRLSIIHLLRKRRVHIIQQNQSIAPTVRVGLSEISDDVMPTFFKLRPASEHQDESPPFSQEGIHHHK